MSNKRANEFITAKFESAEWINSTRRSFQHRLTLFDPAYLHDIIHSLQSRARKAVAMNDVRYTWDYICCPKYGCSEAETWEVVQHYLDNPHLWRAGDDGDSADENDQVFEADDGDSANS